MEAIIRSAATANGGVVTARELGAYDIRPHEIRCPTAEGEGLVQVGPSAYAPASVWRAASPQTRHALRTRAAILAMPKPVLASHTSAAAVLGLPLLNPPGRRIHLTRTTPGTGRKQRDHTLHRSYGPDGADATQPAVLPLLAALGVGELQGHTAGVVTLDAALHTERTTITECRQWLVTLRHRPTLPLLRRIVSAADGRAESPGESRARLTLCALGYDVEPQARIGNDDDEFVARVDFLIRNLGVVVEVDGRVKYRRSDGTGSVEAVLSEKSRESAIRDLGYGIARLPTDIVDDLRRVKAHLDAAARRADPRRRGV